MKTQMNDLTISYPDFILNTTIEPEQFDTNNAELVYKINAIIAEYNALTGSDIPVVSPISSSIIDIQVALDELKAYIDTTKTVLKNTSDAHISNTSNPHNVTASQLGVYTKTELEPYIRGGDTIIKYEIFTILNSNLGNSTFTYRDGDGATRTGILSPEGYQKFTLTKGNYSLGQNRIECTINDTLQRSVASGGLIEDSSTSVILTSPEGNGAEITFKYFERIGVTGMGSGLVYYTTPTITPPQGNIWFKEVT